jgi:hypothetical protein
MPIRSRRTGLRIGSGLPRPRGWRGQVEQERRQRTRRCKRFARPRLHAQPVSEGLPGRRLLRHGETLFRRLVHARLRGTGAESALQHRRARISGGHLHFIHVESLKAMKRDLAWFPGWADSRAVDVTLRTACPARSMRRSSGEPFSGADHLERGGQLPAPFPLPGN